MKPNERLIHGTINSIEKVIELHYQKIRLMEELKIGLLMAERAGVSPEEIEKVGYDPLKDERWKKWPWWLQNRGDGIRPEHNYVILKDGTRIDVPIDWKTALDKAYQIWKADKLKKWADDHKFLKPDVSPAAFKRDAATDIEKPPPE